jgi:hypothetical protein
LLPPLLTDVEKLPGARIIDGKFTAVQQAVGTSPKNKAAHARRPRRHICTAQNWQARTSSKSNLRTVSSGSMVWRV